SAVANARYLLMSCASSQKFSPETRLPQRMMIGIAVTDEMFGASIARPEKVSHWYYFGMMAVAMPCWSLGTALGVAVGNILPALAVSALSVSLYGMFLAIIIPEARRNLVVMGVVGISFLFSFLSTVLPYVKEIPNGTMIIILTVTISTVAALLFPIKDEEAECND
ncbi:MAG: AzlC family ABC transporter permease, partial [Clostridia bacterium]|nr:AzlC family ABC transporter permease [Clostridia bacterium]